VPSVRELAKELRVNPATVAKAYQRLTDTGVLVGPSRRGDLRRRCTARLPETERRRVCVKVPTAVRDPRRIDRGDQRACD